MHDPLGVHPICGTTATTSLAGGQGRKARLFVTPVEATLLACYRGGFGPPARNIKEKRKNIGSGLPQKIGKKTSPPPQKKGKWPENRVLGAIFSYLSAIFSYFHGEAVSYIFPIFSFLFPIARNLFFSRPTGSKDSCGRPTMSRCKMLKAAGRGPSGLSPLTQN